MSLGNSEEMKPTKHSALPNINHDLCQITDVGHFFSVITEAYVHFQESVLQLDHSITTSSPQQILEGFEILKQKRNKLSILDQQMFDIISLAGSEIAGEPMIQEYRVAFARASMACNNLSQNLKALRCSLAKNENRQFSQASL